MWIILRDLHFTFRTSRFIYISSALWLQEFLTPMKDNVCFKIVQRCRRCWALVGSIYALEPSNSLISLVRCSQVKLPNKNQDFSIVHLLTLKNASFVVLTNSKELLFYQKVGLVRQMWSSSISFKCFEECTHAAIFLNVQLQQLHSWHCFNLLDAVVFYVINILCSWFIRVMNIKKMKKFW